MAIEETRSGGDGEVQAANLLVSAKHIADLLPGEVHVIFGVGFDDFRAEVGGDAETWIKIEPMHPIRRIRRGLSVALGQQALCQGVPLPVQR